MASADCDSFRTCTYCGRACEVGTSECPWCGNIFTKDRKC